MLPQIYILHFCKPEMFRYICPAKKKKEASPGLSIGEEKKREKLK
jgi:hypothetical protein